MFPKTITIDIDIDIVYLRYWFRLYNYYKLPRMKAKPKLQISTK